MEDLGCLSVINSRCCTILSKKRCLRRLNNIVQFNQSTLHFSNYPFYSNSILSYITLLPCLRRLSTTAVQKWYNHEQSVMLLSHQLHQDKREPRHRVRNPIRSHHRLLSVQPTETPTLFFTRRAGSEAMTNHRQKGAMDCILFVATRGIISAVTIVDIDKYFHPSFQSFFRAFTTI